jgi:hypothetical protein
MFATRLIHRTLSVGACGAAVLLFASPGRGDAPPPKDPHACMVAYKSAQEKEQAGHLREARDLLASCARGVCGHALKQQCTSRFVALDSADIPSILPAVTDETGAPRLDVQVRMDGELLASRLDGQALSVDPGMHEFSFTTEGGLSATEKVLIVQGQLDRPLTVSLRGTDKATEKGAATPGKDVPGETPPAPGEATAPSAVAPVLPEEKSSESRRSALPYVIGGAALAAGETAALVVYLGKGDTSHLAADVAVGASIGVGAVALGVATWLFLSNHPREEKAPPRAAYKLDVHPTPSGAFASVSGAF